MVTIRVDLAALDVFVVVGGGGRRAEAFEGVNEGVGGRVDCCRTRIS